MSIVSVAVVYNKQDRYPSVQSGDSGKKNLNRIPANNVPKLASTR